MSFRSLHRNIRLRIGVGFVQRFLNVMLMPLMVIYFSELYGGAAAGLLTLVVACVGIACTFLGGHLADTFGRRPVLLLGEVGGFLTFVGMALSNCGLWTSGIATYLCYLLNNSLSCIAQPANDAMIIDVSTPENRTTVYTINYWSINLALAGGSLVGGFLYGGYFSQLLLAAAVFSCGIAAVTYCALPESAPGFPADRSIRFRRLPAVAPVTGAEPPPVRRGGVRTMLTGYLEVLRDTVFGRLLIAAVLTRGIEVQISYYIGVRLNDEFPTSHLLSIGSWDPSVDGVEMLGILRTVNTLLVVVLALFAGRLLGHLPDRTRMYAGIVLFTAGYMVLAVSNAGWLLIGAAAVMTVGEIMNVPVKQTLLADLVRPDARTKYMAAYNLNVRFGLVIGSLCVTIGAVISSWGMSALYGVFGALAILLYRSLFRVHARNKDRGSAASGPAPAPARRSA